MSTIYGIDYGWPATGAVHRDRLVLAGSIGEPDILVASKIGDPTDFALTRTVEEEQIATDADGFFITQSTSRDNLFLGILAQQGLFLFGQQGEATIAAQAAFNANTISIEENSWYGIERGIPPLIVEGLAVYVQEGGGDIRAIAWTEAQQKYAASSLRQIAGDVFDQAVDLAALESTEERAPTVFVPAETGGMGVATLRQTQPPVAWSQWRTGGDVAERQREDTMSLRRRLAAQAVLEGEAGWIGVAALRDLVCFLVDRGGTLSLEVLGEWEAGEPLLDAWRDVTEDPDAAAGEGEEIWSDTGEPGEPVWTAGSRPGGARRVRIGKPYRSIVETVPFVIRTETGARMLVMKSRVFGVEMICDVAAFQARILCNLQLKPLRRRTRGETGASRLHHLSVGNLSGWRNRTTVRLDFQTAAHLHTLQWRVGTR